MSLSFSLLGKLLFVPLAGVGIIYPISQSLTSSTSSQDVNVKLETQEDYKKFCLIVFQGGEKNKEEGKSKKLLACRVNGNIEATNFYFYESEKPFNQSLREVQKIKAVDDGQGKVTVVFSGSNVTPSEETIDLYNGGLWGFLNEVELKSQAKVNWQEDGYNKRITLTRDTSKYRLLTTWN